MNERTELECLQSEFSDLFKSVNNRRPRAPLHLASFQWNDAAFLKEQIQVLRNQIDALQSTFSSRKERHEQGWHVEETDPELLQWAKWLESERSHYYDELDERNAA